MKLKTLDDLKTLMIQLPVLVDSFDDQSTYFCRDLKVWLTKVEQSLASHRRAEVGKIAGLRADVVSAELGVWRENAYHIDPGLVEKNRGVKKKIARAISGQVLNQAQEIVSKVIDPLESVVAEAKHVINQLLLLAVQNGVVDNEQLNNSGAYKDIWVAMVQNVELRPGTQKVLSLVSIPEALCLIGDVLDEWQKQAKAEQYQHSSPPNLTVLPGTDKTQ